MKLKDRFAQAWAQARQFAIDLAGYVFQSKPCYFSKWLGGAALLALFVLGIGLWGNFLAWGQIDLSLGDWKIITAPRLGALQEAILNGQIPWHVTGEMGLRGLTHIDLAAPRYFSLPDILLSPQVILLNWLPVNLFALANTFLLYALGFVGLLALKRKFCLSLAVFTGLFFLFNFNGTITTHLVFGHLSWSGYFLLPFFALLLFEIPTGPLDWRWLLKISLLLAVIFLQGSFHLFVWCLIFIGFIFLFDRKRRKHAFWAVIFALLLSLFRILPGSLEAGQLASVFKTGFTNSGQFLRGMVDLVQPGLEYMSPGNEITHWLGWWEFDFYIGWAGLLFLIVFGVLYWWKEGIHKVPEWVKALYFPMAGLFIFSMGTVYESVFMLQIPLLNAERVATRFWTLPLVFLFILAAIGLQRWLDQYQLSRSWVLTYGIWLLVMANDLKRHLDLWNVAFLKFTVLKEEENYSLHGIDGLYDPQYFWVIIIGCLLSLAALAWLVAGFYRQIRQSKTANE